MAEGAEPDRWMLVLHGIFGMGTNFKGFARALAAAAPRWGFVLPDLRGHGESQGWPPPHDLGAAAQDLERLVASLGRPVRAVAGHSFGGKVALAYLARHPGETDLAFVLDAMPAAVSPDALPEGAARVLAVLESVPRRLPSREAFKAAVSGAGFSASVVEWLAMNVRRAPEGDGTFQLRLDLPAIRSLLADYWARDLWRVVTDERSARELVVVTAGRSHVWGPAERERLDAARGRNPHLAIADLPAAGHWLHVDDPAGLLAVMAPRLAAS